MEFDFGELKSDTNFVAKVQATSESISKVEKSIQDALDIKNYDDLTSEEKVKYDLFLVYAVQSLFWMYLKVNGENPNAVSYIQRVSVNVRDKFIL